MPWYVELVDAYGVRRRVEFGTKYEAEEAKRLQEEQYGGEIEAEVVWSEKLLDVGVVEF